MPLRPLYHNRGFIVGPGYHQCSFAVVPVNNPDLSLAITIGSEKKNGLLARFVGAVTDRPRAVRTHFQ